MWEETCGKYCRKGPLTVFTTWNGSFPHLWMAKLQNKTNYTLLEVVAVVNDEAGNSSESQSCTMSKLIGSFMENKLKRKLKVNLHLSYLFFKLQSTLMSVIYVSPLMWFHINEFTPSQSNFLCAFDIKHAERLAVDSRLNMLWTTLSNSTFDCGCWPPRV